MVKIREQIQKLPPWSVLKIDKYKFLLCEILWTFGKRELVGHRQFIYFGWEIEREEWERYYTHFGPMIVYVLKLGLS